MSDGSRKDPHDALTAAQVGRGKGVKSVMAAGKGQKGNLFARSMLATSASARQGTDASSRARVGWAFLTYETALTKPSRSAFAERDLWSGDA